MTLLIDEMQGHRLQLQRRWRLERQRHERLRGAQQVLYLFFSYICNASSSSSLSGGIAASTKAATNFAGSGNDVNMSIIGIASKRSKASKSSVSPSLPDEFDFSTTTTSRSCAAPVESFVSPLQYVSRRTRPRRTRKTSLTRAAAVRHAHRQQLRRQGSGCCCCCYCCHQYHAVPLTGAEAAVSSSLSSSPLFTPAGGRLSGSVGITHHTIKSLLPPFVASLARFFTSHLHQNSESCSPTFPGHCWKHPHHHASQQKSPSYQDKWRSPVRFPTHPSPSSSSMTLSRSAAAIVSPNRIIRLALTAYVASEILSFFGFFDYPNDTDKTANVRTRLQHHYDQIRFKVSTAKHGLRQWHTNSRKPGGILHPTTYKDRTLLYDDYIRPIKEKYQSLPTKHQFAVGTTIGLTFSPLVWKVSIRFIKIYASLYITSELLRYFDITQPTRLPSRDSYHDSLSKTAPTTTTTFGSALIRTINDKLEGIRLSVRETLQRPDVFVNQCLEKLALQRGNLDDEDDNIIGWSIGKIGLLVGTLIGYFA